MQFCYLEYMVFKVLEEGKVRIGVLCNVFKYWFGNSLELQVLIGCQDVLGRCGGFIGVFQDIYNFKEIQL